MNRKIPRFFAAGIAIIMCLLAVVPVSAAGTNYQGMTGEKTSTTFDKYLVVSGDAHVPTSTFAFTIQPYTQASENVVAGIGSPTIVWDSYKGIGSEPGVNDSADADKSVVYFSPDDQTWTEMQTGDFVKGLTDGKKYAKHTATVDFSGITFPEPNVYRYVITETTASGSGIARDENNVRYLDVYVEDASTSTQKLLKITGYVLHATTATPDRNAEAGTAASDYKDQGFTNRFATYNITFSKTVAGNQGSRDKYFAFKLTVSGALPNTVYTVSLANADATVVANEATDSSFVGETNATSLVTDGEGKLEATFYLQHGQSITIYGFGETTKWKLEENNDGYTPSIVVTSDNTNITKGQNYVEDSGITADVDVAFTNTRESVVPTGILLTVAPFAILMIVGAVGAFIVLKKKNHKENV